MADEGTRVEGLRDLVSALQKAGADLADVKDLMGSIADKAKGYAASAVPVRTGALKRTLKASRAKNYASVSAGNNRKVPYAKPINFGWVKRHIKASNFMQKADQRLRKELPTMLEAGVNKILTERGLQ
jgi:hypothetical protein